MPIFDYVCNSCGQSVELFVKDRFEVCTCDACGDNMIRQFPNRVNIDIFPEDGVHLSNVSANGKTFRSKKEMIRYANKNNLELGALL